jgi:hypothetical protein
MTLNYRFIPRPLVNLSDIDLKNINFNFIKFPKSSNNYTLNTSSLLNKKLLLDDFKKSITNLNHFFNSLNSNKYKLEFGLCGKSSTIHPELLKRYSY